MGQALQSESHLRASCQHIWIQRQDAIVLDACACSGSSRCIGSLPLLSDICCCRCRGRRTDCCSGLLSSRLRGCVCRGSAPLGAPICIIVLVTSSQVVAKDSRIEKTRNKTRNVPWADNVHPPSQQLAQPWGEKQCLHRYTDMNDRMLVEDPPDSYRSCCVGS